MNARTLLLLLTLSLMEFPTPAAWAQSTPYAQLIEEAKKEGQLNWYTTMSVVDHTRYLQLFNQKLVQLGRKASSRTDVETDMPKTVKFIPEDLSIYDRVNEARAEIEKLLLR